jgi:hypothetical protein
MDKDTLMTEFGLGFHQSAECTGKINPATLHPDGPDGHNGIPPFIKSGKFRINDDKGAVLIKHVLTMTIFFAAEESHGR